MPDPETEAAEEEQKKQEEERKKAEEAARKAEEQKKKEEEQKRKEQERLEEIARKEHEKTSPEAKQEAQYKGYFDRLGQQNQLAKESVKTVAKVAGTAAVLGVAAYTGFTLFGTDSLVMMGGVAGGDTLAKLKNKEKITCKTLMVRGIAGSLLGGYAHYAFPAIHYVGDSLAGVAAGAGASSLGTTAASIAGKSVPFFGAFLPGWLYLENNVMYPILDREAKPMSMKELTKTYAKVLKPLWLPAGLNINFTPVQYQIPAAAAITTLYGFISAKPKPTQQPK